MYIIHAVTLENPETFYAKPNKEKQSSEIPSGT